MPFIVAFIASLVLAAPWSAETAPAERCADAYEAAQRKRNTGDLEQALEAAIACAQQGCPEVLRADCTRWVGELTDALPTVVVDVRDARGQPVADVVLAIDGEPAADTLDGRAIPVNPGHHTFSIRTADGTAVSKEALVVEGRKSQVVEIELPPAKQAGIAEPPNVIDDDAPASAHAPWTTRRMGAWAATGMAVAATGSFAFFGLRGLDRRSDLQSSCGGACPPGERDPITRDFLIADVSLAISIAAAATAIWLWVADDPATTRQEVTGAGWTLQAGAARGGGWLRAGTGF